MNSSTETPSSAQSIGVAGCMSPSKTIRVQELEEAEHRIQRKSHAPSCTFEYLFELGVLACYTCKYHVTCAINKPSDVKNVALKQFPAIYDIIILSSDNHQIDTCKVLLSSVSRSIRPSHHSEKPPKP